MKVNVNSVNTDRNMVNVIDKVDYEHYFVDNPKATHKKRLLIAHVRGRDTYYYTDSSIFSSTHLDRGTELLINSIYLNGTESVLDVGCGAGIIGIALSYELINGHVIMTDVNKRAIKISKENIKNLELKNIEVMESNIFENLKDKKFNIIVTNPPYRAGRKIVLNIIDNSPEHLEEHGCFYMVGKRSEGIIYYQKYIKEKYKNINVIARKGGYRVIMFQLFD